MSNYLFAVGSNDAVDSIYRFLMNPKHPEEVRKHDLGNNKSALIVSKEISDDGSNFFFKGWFVDPFRMYSQEKKPKNGPPMTFLNLVESIKKSYPTPVAMIRDLLDETWNLLDD